MANDYLSRGLGLVALETSFKEDIKDNNENYVSPEHIRNSIFTTYSNIPLLPIYKSGKLIIGINNTNTDYETIPLYLGSIANAKPTFFEGAKKGDFIFSSNGVNTSETNLIFIAGNSNKSFTFTKFPTLSSYITIREDGTERADLKLDNENGNIDLISEHGSVAINGLKFPTIDDTNKAIKDQVLVLGEDNQLRFDVNGKGEEIESINMEKVIYTINDKKTTISVGHIPKDYIFKKNSTLKDVFDLMLYNIKAIATLTGVTTYYEINSNQDIVYTYTITRGSSPIARITSNDFNLGNINYNQATIIIPNLKPKVFNKTEYGTDTFTIKAVDENNMETNTSHSVIKTMRTYHGKSNSATIDSTNYKLEGNFLKGKNETPPEFRFVGVNQYFHIVSPFELSQISYTSMGNIILYDINSTDTKFFKLTTSNIIPGFNKPYYIYTYAVNGVATRTTMDNMVQIKIK